MNPALREAACVGVDPSIFDHYRFPDAHLGLAFCHGCPVPTHCMEAVRPQKSHFDGIAGGVVWRNGYRVRPDNSTREDRFIRMRQRGEQ